jgi:molybdate/tungstate transport system ATP-binding protein
MIALENLQVILPDFHIRDVNLHIETGEFFVLMGPTGAGKTVLLEAIAGLVSVNRGRVFVGDQEVTNFPPEKRGVAIVYQDFALFPHLTVRDNITYGLHFRKLHRKHARERLDWLVETLDLGRILHRIPLNLSGGEGQRVALARALMVEPAILLLDEPLSALDPGFREEIRNVLKRLHRASGVTFLMVTHDFAEALSLADRAAIMHEGRIKQVGTVRDVFQRPLSTFVADFVGMKNIFLAEFVATKAFVNDLGIELGAEPTDGQRFIAIRPEDIVLSTGPLESSMRNSFRGTVTGIFDQGFYYDIHVLVNQVTFRSLITKASLLELQLDEGVDVFLSFKSTAVHHF